jgi:hypothetical protein
MQRKYELTSLHLLEDTLLAFNWLKTYDTEPLLGGRHGICKTTVRHQSKGLSERIQGLYKDNIYLRGFQGEIIGATLNGFNYHSFEFANDQSAKYYDHKSHSADVKHEIAVAIHHPRIVWINRPFPTLFHDISISEVARQMNNHVNGMLIHCTISDRLG